MRDSVLLDMGIMGVPLGLVVVFEAARQESSWVWFIAVILGFLVMFLGLAIVYKLFKDGKEKDKQLAKKAADREKREEWRDKILAQILIELSRQNQDLKGGGKDDTDKHSSV